MLSHRCANRSDRTAGFTVRALLLWVTVVTAPGCATDRSELSRDREAYHAALARGQAAEEAGDLDAAAQSFQSAVEVANANRFLEAVREPAQNDLERVRAGQLANAGVASRARIQQARVPSQLNERAVLDQWTAASASSDTAIRQTAYNDVGALHLRQKKYAQAAEDFRQALASDANAPASDRAVLNYNRGRAIELWLDSAEGGVLPPDRGVELRRESLNSYLAAGSVAGADPTVIRAGFRAARAVQPPTAEQAGQVAAWAVKLIDDGRAGAVLPELLNLLSAWSDSPHARPVIDALAVCFAARKVTPDEFDKQYEPGLQNLYRADRNPAFVEPIKQLRKAYEQSLTSLDTAEEVRQRFSAWRGRPHAAAFSRLLKSVGDAYVRDKRHDRAAARYWSAVVLDPGNFDAMLYTAAILREHGKQIDRDGKIASQFESLVFEEKSNAYRYPPTSPAGWRKLVQIHAILAKGYMEQKRFGPPGDVRTAIFQWSRAIDAERRARETDPSTPVSTDLFEGLGEAYASFQQPGEARKQFLAAAQHAIRNKDPDGGRRAIDAWGKVAAGASPEENIAIQQAVKDLATAHAPPR